MVVIVDGYNVIKYMLSHHQHEHEGQRAWLIDRMSRYFQAKQDEVQDIIVVFDGGASRHQQREVHKGIVTVFAGHTYSADDVIVRYAEQFHAGAAVVTNDRELSRRCQQHRSAVLKVQEFFDLVGQVGRVEQECFTEHLGSVIITKLEDEDGADAALDELMVSASIGPGGAKHDDDHVRHKEKGYGKKQGKKERARQRLHAKLG